MRMVIDGIWMMEHLRGCNTYLVACGSGHLLVDAGLARDSGEIRGQLSRAGITAGGVRTIVLTHAHEDHVGGAAGLAGSLGAAVFCHENEVPYIRDGRKMRFGPPAFRLLMRLGEIVRGKPAPCRIDRVLKDGDLLEEAGLRVISCPGHTPGSISLYDERARVLFCGDAMFNVNPLNGKAGLRPSIPLFTMDMDAAIESIRKLSLLDVEVLLPGHGEPIPARGGECIRAMLSEQDRPR